MQLEQPPSLPAADAESAAHSRRVADFIGNKIHAAGGEISFAEYMHHALYAPGLGYYSAGTTKFGAAGDFITAPEISSVFGHVLARQCAGVLGQVESPSILEFGAGSGKLAADLLMKLADIDALPVSYRILEVSADLRQRQEEFLNSAIPDLTGRVSWLDRLPDEHAGVIIANEVLDALPVERFVRRGGDVVQICVAARDDAFVITERAAPAALLAAVDALEEGVGQCIPDGYVTEVCTAAPQWVGDLARVLSRGAAFFVRLRR